MACLSARVAFAVFFVLLSGASWLLAIAGTALCQNDGSMMNEESMGLAWFVIVLHGLVFLTLYIGVALKRGVIGKPFANVLVFAIAILAALEMLVANDFVVASGSPPEAIAGFSLLALHSLTYGGVMAWLIGRDTEDAGMTAHSPWGGSVPGMI